MKNKSSISILEFGGDVDEWHGDSIVLSTGTGLNYYLWDGESLEGILCNPVGEGCHLTMISVGAFLTPFRRSKLPIQTFFILYDQEGHEENPPMDIIPDYRLGRIYETDDRLYAYSSIDYENEMLVMLDKSEMPPKVTKTLELDWSNLDMDSDVIVCSCNRARQLMGLTHELDELWKVDLGEEEIRYGPWLYNDRAIVYAFKKITAIDKTNGEIVWEKELDTYPSSICFFDGKIYVAVIDLYVINATTGEVECKKKSDLTIQKEISRVQIERNMYWMQPSNGCVAIVSPMDNLVQIRSLDDLSYIDSIQIPEGYILDENWIAGKPKIHNEKMIFTLSTHNCYHTRARMMIDLASYQPGDQIHFMPKPQIDYYFVPKLEEAHAYSISIDANTVYEAVGYAEVAVKELATEIRQNKSDDSTVKTNWVDELHNGVINVILDSLSFDEHQRGVIQLEIDEINSSMKTNEHTYQMLGIFPKSLPPLKINLKFVEKSEWAKEGEQVDFEQFIAEKAME